MNEIKTILAIGSIAIDSVQSPSGERKNVLGGSVNYFSLAASLFAPVKVVGVVGNDYPKEGWQLYKSRNIDINNIQVMDGKTFRWGCKYNHDYSSRKTLFTELGVFESFCPDIRDNDLCSPLVFLGNIQPDLQLKVAKSTVGAEYIVSDTMNLWIEKYPDTLRKVMAISNIFLINHEEAFQITGLNNIPSAALRLHTSGPKIVIIKMGSEGAYVSFNRKAFYVPVFPVEKVIDPTGAGDSFAGGFMGFLAQTSKIDIVEAVLAGSAVASYSVEGFGLESILNITREGLDERISIIRNRMFAEENI